MDQQEFFRYIFGDRTGYIEVRDAGPLQPQQHWVQYPILQPITGVDLSFRPAVVPLPGAPHESERVVTISADVDDDCPLTVPPSVLTRIDGTRRSQAYWRVSQSIPWIDLEDLRARLDPFGQVAEFLPIPETTVSKFGTAAAPLSQLVVIEARPSLRTWKPDELRLLEPPLQAPPVTLADATWTPDPQTLGSGVQFFISQRLAKNPDLVKVLGSALTRPKYDFDKIIRALLETDLALHEVIWIARQAQCNPNLALSYEADWETARHVAKVAATFLAPGTGIIKTITSIRRRKGAAFMKNDDIATVIIKDAKSRGQLLHARDGTYWYVDHESGEALELGDHNERLQILLTRRYGLNPTDQVHRHVIREMVAEAGSQPKTAERATLAYYRPQSAERGGGELLVHFGGREIGVLSGGGMIPAHNGHSGLIFTLPSEADPVVTSALRTDLPHSWWDEFLPPSYFRSLQSLEPEIASALMRVWAQFVLFREDARTRPLLAFLGPIQSGKSTFARRLYHLFYGSRKELTAIEGQREYDTITSNNPFVVFDNLDHCPPWLPAKLEMSITPREQDRRKLFTDNTIYHIRCDAIVGITATDATIFREGTIDRMLVLMFRRLEDTEKLPDSDLAREVTERRERFLSGLLSDARRILQTPRRPFRSDEWSRTIRVMDFVDTGAWFAEALGVLDEFKQAVDGLKRRQTSLIIEGETTLIDALETYTKYDTASAAKWHTATELYTALKDNADNQEMFVALYKTPSVFATKLRNIYMQVRDVFGLEFQEDPRTTKTMWRITGGTAGT